METQEKYKFLKEMDNKIKFSDSEIKIIESLSDDSDVDIRYEVAQNLVFVDSEISDSILLKLLKDKDLMVRVNACDSLCNSKSIKVFEILKTMVNDKSALMRGYTVTSLADITKNIYVNIDEITLFLKKSFTNENSEWVKISYYYAFYCFGDKSYYESLLFELNNSSYKCRCAVVNTIEFLFDENQLSNDEIKLTCFALKMRLKIEKGYAVESSIIRVLDKLK